ncbi:MAG: hypothetical protein LUE87_12850 [Lachnospiraceae bacterium]|nr:hypothetical protein [Lachnospiraceae bacterium]
MGCVTTGSWTTPGGTISDNTASNYGGGVYVSSGGSFTIEAGTISGNTATTYYG